MNEDIKYKTIKAVVEQGKSKKRANVKLDLSIRQINRLIKAYKEEGKAAFIHKNRGKQPKNKVSQQIEKEIIDIYFSLKNTPNFKHFTDILSEFYDIHYFDTTIRRILYQVNISSPESQRKTKRLIKARVEQKKKTKETDVTNNPYTPTAEQLLEETHQVHPSRPRKKYYSELIQMDASLFVWFGEQLYHLHVAIDDASGKIVGAYFDTQETLNGYYHVLHQILNHHGVPATFLTDHRTVFIYEAQGTKKM